MALALGCIIGFGCFVLPGDFLEMAGPMGAVLGVSIGGIAMLVIAANYGRMIAEIPVAGGAFAYAYHTAGRYHAYICGWMLTLGYLSIVPLNAMALAVLARFIAPDVFARGYLYSIAGFEVFAGEIALATAAIVVVGLFQLRGVREVGGVQLATTLLLVGAVLVIALGAVTYDGWTVSNLIPAYAPERSAAGSVLAILALSPWLYVGFDTLPQSAEEFAFTPSCGRRLMAVAILAGAAMYATVILATAAVIPWRELLATETVWATGHAVTSSLGDAGLTILIVAVCMAILTGINGFYLAGSRLLFSMGRAGMLPSWFAAVHPERRVPYNAILFVGGSSLIAPWIGRQVILWIVDVSALGTAVAYMYTCVAAYGLARVERRPWTVFRHRILPGLGVALSAGFVLLLTVPGMPAFMDSPSWIALAVWLLLGAWLFRNAPTRVGAVSGEVLDALILGQGGRGRLPVTPTERDLGMGIAEPAATATGASERGSR